MNGNLQILLCLQYIHYTLHKPPQTSLTNRIRSQLLRELRSLLHTSSSSPIRQNYKMLLFFVVRVRDKKNQKQNAIKTQFCTSRKRKSWNIATEIVKENSRCTFRVGLLPIHTSSYCDAPVQNMGKCHLKFNVVIAEVQCEEKMSARIFGRNISTAKSKYFPNYKRKNPYGK